MQWSQVESLSRDTADVTVSGIREVDLQSIAYATRDDH